MKKNPLELVKSFLDYVDGGDFFRTPVKWLYVILAGLNVLVPFFILYSAIESGTLSYLSGGAVFAFILIWLVLLAGFVLLGLLWWYRKDLKGTHDENNSEFPVTPIFAHIIRTLGEWLGIFIGVISPVVLLIALIFSGSDFQTLAYMMDIPMGNLGIIGLITLPLTGFLCFVFFRFLSEQIKVLVTIARNTKK